MSRFLYDNRLNRNLTDADLPDGVTVETLAVYLEHNFVTFHSLETTTGDGWVPYDGLTFRVGTKDFPSRGVNITFSGFFDWVNSIKTKPDQEFQDIVLTDLVALAERAKDAGLVWTAVALQSAADDCRREAKRLSEARAVLEAA